MVSSLMFICNHLQPIINSLGLIFDIVGATLVASEVVYQFNGERFKATHEASKINSFRNDELRNPVIYTPPANEAGEYTDWESRKYRKMKIGLGILIIGFVLQIASN